MSHTSFTKLLAIQTEYNLSYVIKERPVDWLCWVEVHSAAKSWELLVYDECHDLSAQKPLICLYLMLFTLEDYADTSDYLEWSKENLIEPPAFIDYYKSLETSYREIKKLLGNIESYISSMDYELRSGAFDELLRWSNP
ncbi:MAG: hypothetical protein AAGG59_05775 [Bacteroidota bacterium]